MPNLRAHNVENYEVAKKVQLFVRKAGSVAAADWISLGSVKNVQIESESTPLEHFSNYLGRRAKDREEVIERRLRLDFTLEELNVPNLKLAFGRGFRDSEGGSPTKDVKHETTVDNPGGAQTIDLGKTNIKNVIVRSVGLETPVTYVEGVGQDYTVNLATGVITILAGGDLEIAGTVPEIHIFFEQEQDVEEFEMFDGEPIQCELQFQFGAAGQVEKVIGPCDNAYLRNAGPMVIGDGSDWQEIPMQAEVTVEANGSFGTVGVIKETQS